ncbi:MAG: tyrosine-type recombinase/integrase, partial [bacterium]
MASIATSPDGLVRILFSAGGSRRTLYCGRIKPKAAVVVKSHVEALVEYPRTNVLPPATAAWVSGLDDTMHARLVRVGLLPDQAARHRRTVGNLLEQVRTARPHWAQNTINGFASARRSIEQYVGADAPLESVTPAQAEGFAAFMAGQGLARTTASKRVAIIRQAFTLAVRWKWLRENPFADVKAGGQVNRDRLAYVDVPTFERVLEHVADPETRLVLCMGRFAGLRLPSEAMNLRWSDLSDWGATPQTLTINATKTGTTRTVPVLPRLATELLAAWERAPDGAEFVLSDRRRSGCGNWRRGLEWAAKRAGVALWPRAMHSLRASFATDISARFPSHVARAWCGHSEEVAVAHYLSTLPTDLTRACTMA